MTENASFVVVTAIIAAICLFGWYQSHRKLQTAERAIAAYLALLESQKVLVDSVLDLNASMLADRLEMQRQQEAEFISHSRVGYVH